MVGDSCANYAACHGGLVVESQLQGWDSGAGHFLSKKADPFLGLTLGIGMAAKAPDENGQGGYPEQNEQAQQRVPPELADLQPEQALLENADHGGAQQRPENCSRAAENIDPAYDDRRDRFQLKAETGHNSDVAEFGEKNEAEQAG